MDNKPAGFIQTHGIKLGVALAVLAGIGAGVAAYLSTDAVEKVGANQATPNNSSLNSSELPSFV